MILIPKNKLLKLHQQLTKDKRFNFIKKLFKKFPKIEIYLVGGAVRDALLNITEQKDFDFVVRNITPKQLKDSLTKSGNINLVGKTFGVFKFMPKNIKGLEPIDIAFPRTEHAFGTGGYRDVKIRFDPKMEIEKDLARRDFTINALAWDLKNKKIIDPYNGFEDLKKKTIQTVGNPSQRFKEDYSRIIRALRFVCQFDFKIEQKTFSALKNLIVHLNDQRLIKGKKERIIPYEIIARELLKTFYYNPVKAFDLYDETKAFKVLMPEVLKMKGCPQPKIFHSEGDVWTHTRLALEKIESKEFQKQFGKKAKNIELIITVLFHDLGKPYTIQTPKKNNVDRIRFNEHDVTGAKIAYRICKRLKLDSQPENSLFHLDIDNLKKLIEKHMLLVHSDPDEMRSGTIEKYFFNPNFPGQNLLKLFFVDALATLPPDGKPDLKNFYKLIKRIDKLDKLSKEKAKLPPPILDGNEIMKRFKLSSGPLIGELIEVLREAQLTGKINKTKTKKEQKEIAFKYLKEYLKKR